MSGDAALGVEVRSRERLAPAFEGHVRQQMVNVREALRMGRLARNQRFLQDLYDEHSMSAEACGARGEMMELLRTARSHWRLALGLVP